MKDKCVDLLIKAHKKLNYIEGFRRIVLVIIGFGVLCALFCYVCGGFILDTSRFENNVKIKSLRTTYEENIRSFAKDFTNFKNENYYYPAINCKPYKQECQIDKEEFLIFKNGENKFLETKIKVEMPSRLQYFTWQVLDFLLIFGLAFLAWALYLAIEMILVWIFAGFKSNKK